VIPSLLGDAGILPGHVCSSGSWSAAQAGWFPSRSKNSTEPRSSNSRGSRAAGLCSRPARAVFWDWRFDPPRGRPWALARSPPVKAQASQTLGDEPPLKAGQGPKWRRHGTVPEDRKYALLWFQPGKSP